ncbi:hypothetical protein RND81_01G141100 [Saponaria officinalis]|uniref:Transmembrane protein n=1 Tax=Saponaria officinalis TaxID=3572 RepID=A0AAW1NF82_SAPOF
MIPINSTLPPIFEKQTPKHKTFLSLSKHPNTLPKPKTHAFNYVKHQNCKDRSNSIFFSQNFRLFGSVETTPIFLIDFFFVSHQWLFSIFLLHSSPFFSSSPSFSPLFYPMLINLNLSKKFYPMLGMILPRLRSNLINSWRRSKI